MTDPLQPPKFKPQIRLPGDDDHGPNPYDSKTQITDLPKNAWLTKWGWWLAIGAMAIGWVATHLH